MKKIYMIFSVMAFILLQGCNEQALLDTVKDVLNQDSADLLRKDEGYEGASILSNISSPKIITPEMEQVEINITRSTPSMHLMEDFIFEATVSNFPTGVDADANSYVVWSSSDDSVAFVSMYGMVFSVRKAGTVTITATSVYNPNKSASVEVNVIPEYRDPEIQEVRIFRGNEDREITYEMDTKSPIEFLAQIEKRMYFTIGTIWESSNPDVATMSSWGLIGRALILSPGETTITVKSKVDPSKFDTFKLIVNGIKIKIDQDKSLLLKVGDTIQLSTSIVSHGITDETVTWKSSDDSTVSVTQDGSITVKQNGTADITAFSFSYPTEFSVIQINVAEAGVFTSEWDTSKSGVSNNNQIQLPLHKKGTYDFVVDWGDGNSDTITVWDAPEKTHSYAKEGNYDVGIKGTLKGWRFSGGGDKNKLINIKSWGTFNFGKVADDTNGIFSGTSNLTITATDTPVLTDANFVRAFRDSNVSTIPGIENWNTIGVTDMSGMFNAASNFEGDLSNWKTENVTDMSFMFYGATNISSLDASNWNVSSVTDMSWMFAFTNIYKPEYFKTDLSRWDISQVKNMTGMILSSYYHTIISSESYDKILIAWSKLPVQPNLVFHPSGQDSVLVSYSVVAEAARKILTETHGWKIVDGGLKK